MIRTFTVEQLRDMSLEDAETHLSNAVYQATAILEGLEHAGKVFGNGHHARQNAALAAVVELRGRWKEAQ